MEAFNAGVIAGKVLKEVREKYASLSTLNIMVLGKIGVGKSTLVNTMFNEKLAATGSGKPITLTMKKYTKPNFPLAIYDTPGIELGGANAVNSIREEVINEIQRCAKSGDINDMIHCILYCVGVPSNRFEEYESDFVRSFAGEASEYNIPVIIVLTQAYFVNDAENLKREIEKENLPICNIVPVLAEKKGDIQAYGLRTLSNVMMNALPSQLQDTFISVQRVNLKMKQKKAHATVATSAVAAMATGAVPIPFSDAAVLVPEQIAMLTAITVEFGLPIDKGTITAVVSSTVGTTGATVLGKTIVSNLFKFVPGVGSVVGGAISGSTAAALTAALGEAYIGILTMICEGELKQSALGTDEGKRIMNQLFQDSLKVKRNSKGERI